ncbi:L,D-transpeptidase [Paenibacillus sp. TRM 82003]|nr:L,D-transpeptidase [Paenibacillus sp. TRM 82003]
MGDSRLSSGRFGSPTKKHIVPLRSNIYINPADPRYYEKVLQYVDSSSPEALYNVGMKLIHQGERAKGVELLNRCVQTRTSMGRRAKEELDRMQRAEEAQPNWTYGKSTERGGWPWKWIAATLALLLLFLLLVDLPAVKNVLTRMVMPTANVDVIYDTSEQPFLMYFDAEKSPKEIESTMYDEIRELGSHYPEQVVQIYGLYLISGKTEGIPLPLRDVDLKQQAFVMAEYHADAGENVKIRFFPPSETVRLTPEMELYLQISANLVRTALQQFQEDHGKLPDRIQELLADYPDNYLSFIPMEPTTNSALVTVEQHGDGGWIYDPSSTEPQRIFRPDLEWNPPYFPVEVMVVKSKHTLYLMNGPHVFMEKMVGLGKEGLTPSGTFRIDKRVLNPQGGKPGVYGAAALGFGAWALHGTNAPESVGANESLGCVRLLDQDIAELYPYIPLGTGVFIEEIGPNDEQYRYANKGWKNVISAEYARHDEKAGAIQFSWLQ